MAATAAAAGQGVAAAATRAAAQPPPAHGLQSLEPSPRSLMHLWYCSGRWQDGKQTASVAFKWIAFVL